MPKYTEQIIAQELVRTALGESFFGNALRVAKDLPYVNAQERSLLDRWATGKQGGTDHLELQALANKVMAHAPESLGTPAQATE